MGFEGHRLNDMIDLADQAKPEDIESVGKALQGARNAIASAARELGRHIDRVDWEGEAGEAFRKWGKDLVKDTHKLSDFAAAASSHMESAGAGLASVRASMPPRDNRADPKAVEDIPLPKRAEGNEEYGAAVKAEKHRQEAINQMNRLASFYLVSREGMARQEPPTFSAMPDVGLPAPARLSPGVGGGGQQSSAATTESAQAPHSAAAGPDQSTRIPEDTQASGETGSSNVPPPSRSEALPPMASTERPVGTEIDSVGTLPPRDTSPVPGPQPTSSGPAPNDGGPPMGAGRFDPTANGRTGRVPGPGGEAKRPMLAQGRVGTGGSKGAHEGAGRGSTAPVRHAGPTAQGRSISGPSGPGQPPVGRSVTGGSPRPMAPAGRDAGAPHSTGAGQARGVVGGRPASSPPSGSSGSTEGRGQRHLPGNPGGVVGNATGPASAATSRTSGFSTGGSGLVRGPSGVRRRAPGGGERSDAQRADYAVEDEETHLPAVQRQVPPVID